MINLAVDMSHRLAQICLWSAETCCKQHTDTCGGPPDDIDAAWTISHHESVFNK
jgi:hypothetical protein